MASDNDDSGDIPGSSPRPEGIASLPQETLELAYVYREHFAFVWRFLRSRGATPDQADDLTQETFVIVERKLETFEGRSSLRTWVAGIAFNVARQQSRREAREVPTAPLDAVFDGASQDTSPREAVQLNEEAGFIQSVLDRMSLPQREAFVLIELEGFSSVEAAELLGVNEFTARSRLRAARLLLNRAIETRQQSEA